MTDAELIRIGREAGLDIELMTEIGRNWHGRLTNKVCAW